MIPGTRWDWITGRWQEFLLWLVKPFTRCGNDNLCIFIRSEFPRHNGELWELVLSDATPIYVYYCPWCGRKLKNLAAQPQP